MHCAPTKPADAGTALPETDAASTLLTTTHCEEHQVEDDVALHGRHPDDPLAEFNAEPGCASCSATRVALATSCVPGRHHG